jgi:DNA-binding response OmpR family regulator
MHVTWGRFPRLPAGEPRNLGPAPAEASVNARRVFRPKTFSVQGPRRTVEVGEREWELLSLLFEYRGTYLTRETILSRVWGPYYVNQSGLFEETLTALRASMKRAGYPGNMIHEQRDLGYGIRSGELDGKSR